MIRAEIGSGYFRPEAVPDACLRFGESVRTEDVSNRVTGECSSVRRFPVRRNSGALRERRTMIRTSDDLCAALCITNNGLSITPLSGRRFAGIVLRPDAFLCCKTGIYIQICKLRIITLTMLL